MAETPTQGEPTDQQAEVIFGTGGEGAPPTPPRRRFPWWIVLVVLVLAMVVVAVVHYMQASKPVDLVEAVGPDVDLWMEFDVGATEAREAKLKSLVEAIEKSGLEKQAARLLEKSSDQAGFRVKWEEEVKPWVGHKFGFAVSGVFESAMGGSMGAKPPSLLGVMAVRNPRRAEAFFGRLTEHLRAKEQWKVSTQSQHGVVIHVCRPPSSFSEGEDLCYAMTRSVLLLSNRPSEVAEAIVRLKGRKEGLATAAWYQQAIAKAPEDAVGRGVFSTEHMSDFYQAMGAGLPEENRRQLEQMMAGATTTGALWFDVAGGGLTCSSFAFPSKGESHEARQALIAASKENAWNTAFTSAPKDSMATLGMLGVADYYRIFAKQIAAGPFSFGIHMFEAQTGLKLEEDVFGWMRGLTVTLVSVGKGPMPVQMVGELTAESPEMAKAKAEKLVGAASRLGGLVTRPAQAGGSAATELLFAGNPVLCYAVVGNAVVIASDTSSLAAGLRAKKDATARIAAGEAWKKAAATQTQPAWCAVFADTQRIAKVVNSAIPASEMDEGGEEAVGLLRSILWVAMSGGAGEDGYHSSVSAGLDYPDFCQNLTALLKRAEEKLPEGRNR